MIITTSRRGGLRGYMAGSSLIPRYSFMTPPAPPATKPGCGCRKALGAVEDSPYFTDETTQTFIGPLPAPTDYATPAEIAAASNVGSQAVPGLTHGVPGGGSYGSGTLTMADSLVGIPGGIGGGLAPAPSLFGLSSQTVLYGGLGLFVFLLLMRRR